MSLARRSFLVALATTFPLAALAAGAHDSVGCSGCHSIHTAKGEIIFAVPQNKTMLNPKTKQPYTGTTALCLGCHADSKEGGQGYAPVNGHMSHPFGLASVNPKIAKVPPELLREGGRFECLGCHDPHPSNPYYKYLRVDTAKGSKMDAFCAVCHPIKADVATAKESAVLFTSMDETGDRVLKAPAPAPAAAPKAPAKKK
ncbi:cytochrome c3 family protein [Anaeromyxobacter oryzisoli]|uniref:cytochrome c3 family protein n=1 Tax=Anaeromyxobacter oryzisoli TaxID=2925408 RepID=UPI001F56AE70|nr:cytochrome c3 family protein [Anaeromyxobacter sp. SG63]